MRDLLRRWQNWTVLLLGTWLLLSPLVLHADGVAASNAKLVGLAFVLFASLAVVEQRMWEEWVNLVVAVWLVVSPFVLGFTDRPAAAWNAIITGFLAGAIALRAVTGAGRSAERA